MTNELNVLATTAATPNVAMGDGRTQELQAGAVVRLAVTAAPTTLGTTRRNRRRMKEVDLDEDDIDDPAIALPSSPEGEPSFSPRNVLAGE